jgi:hypothetical protein
MQAINSLKNVDSTALLQFLHPILNMLLHLIGNGGETLQVCSSIGPFLSHVLKKVLLLHIPVNYILLVQYFPQILWISGFASFTLNSSFHNCF